MGTFELEIDFWLRTAAMRTFLRLTLADQRHIIWVDFITKVVSMTKRALFPAGSEASAAQIKVSPGVVSGNHVFLTGMTGSRSDGTMPNNLKEQFRRAFEKIGSVLKEAGLTYDSIVEMTTYHVGLRDHFNTFNEIRSEYVSDPFPAWTAVEVAGLRREGAVVDIRAVATMEPD